MSSATPDAPWLPHLCGAGLMVCGGATIGYNPGGRLTNWVVSQDNRSAAIDIDAERLGNIGRTDGNLFTFLNGTFSAVGGSDVYRANRKATSTVLTFDAFPLPPADYWKNFKTSLYAIWPPVVNLTWQGDDETSRYVINYANESDKSDSKVVARYSRNDYIETTKNTNTTSPDEIRVVGIDGSSTGKSSYTVTVNRTVDTVTITAVNDVTGVTELSAVEYADVRLPFGAGLYIDLPNGWITTGDTEFTVKAGPNREYSLASSVSDDHYFRVDANRLNESTVNSVWKLKTVNMPPSPVSAITTTFLSDSSVRIGFSMPSDTDIEGWRLYLSPDWRTGHYIPHWNPIVSGTAAASAAVTTDLTGLSEGKYTFMVRSYDDQGRDDMTVNIQEFYLSATAVSLSTLTEPLAFQVAATDLSTIRITSTTDRSETNLYVYWDNGTGTVAYTSAGIWDILPKTGAGGNSRRAKYSKTYYNVPAGTYKFGIRSERSGELDGNTYITDTVTVNDVAISVPYDLEITVGSSG